MKSYYTKTKIIKYNQDFAYVNFTIDYMNNIEIKYYYRDSNGEKTTNILSSLVTKINSIEIKDEILIIYI